jgi:hypothetical protein
MRQRRSLIHTKPPAGTRLPQTTCTSLLRLSPMRGRAVLPRTARGLTRSFHDIRSLSGLPPQADPRASSAQVSEVPGTDLRGERYSFVEDPGLDAFLIEFPTQPNREIFRRNRELIRRNREFSFGIRDQRTSCPGYWRQPHKSAIHRGHNERIPAVSNQAPGIVPAVQDPVGAARTRLSAVFSLRYFDAQLCRQDRRAKPGAIAGDQESWMRSNFAVTISYP